MVLPDYPMMSVQDYFALDGASQIRYEYLDEELRMQAGGSMNHSHIDAESLITLSRFLTEAFGREQKFVAYRESSSLQEYVLINSQQPLVEVYTCAEASWTLRTFKAKDKVELTSLNIHFPVAAL